ncbi:penicillin-binding transpeptidase domain-containing protein [Ornithinimicrobium panacihumi]|uniref:penicillin-binding transpeptidase domain-containing protein n=1 Tax=Ornithinimicrobium panacihumi TaxID=2008449 RepID=UPI003F89E013
MVAARKSGTTSQLGTEDRGIVRGKSGTAEFGSEDPPRTHVWMIAIQGDLAVAVFVEEGDFGSTTAGPIMDDFLTSVQQDRN